MNENVVKALRVCTSERTISKCSKICPYHNVQDCRTKLMIDAADAIEELSKPRWIPVTERLPENAGEYIVYLHPWDDGTMDDWGYTTAMHFDKGQSLWICDGTSYNAVLSAVNTETEYHITHWMPLPTPPKEET